MEWGRYGDHPGVEDGEEDQKRWPPLQSETLDLWALASDRLEGQALAEAFTQLLKCRACLATGASCMVRVMKARVASDFRYMGFRREGSR